MAEQIIRDNLVARKIGVCHPFTVAHLAEVSGASEVGAYAWMKRRTKKQKGPYMALRWIYKNKTYMMLIPRGTVVYGLSTVEMRDADVDGGVVVG